MSSKTVLITGCSSGIGLCCAKGLKARGHRIFATARKKEDLAHLEKLGLEALSLDVDDSKSIKHLISEIKARADGKIDVLFNNCSYAIPGAIEDLTRDAVRAQFETNVFGPLELTNGIIKLMREQGYGRIIQMGSILGLVTMPYCGAYNMSKFALEGLTDTLRQELRGSNITVSIIEPGPIHSKFRKHAKESFDQYIDYKNSVHKKEYARELKGFFKINEKKAFYLQPEAVLKKVVRIVESRKPKARYYVGLPSYFFMFLKRLLPAFLLDRVIWLIVDTEVHK